MATIVELINNLLDHLVAVSWRLLELPLYLLIICMLFVFLLIGRILIWRFGHLKLKFAGMLTLLFFLLLVGLIADAKFNFLYNEITLLQEKYMKSLLAEDSNMDFVNNALYLNPKLQKESNTFLKDFNVWGRSIEAGIDLLVMRKENPKVVIYCAVVDLECPGIELVITPFSSPKKTLTSDFAKKHNCTIAINGEAGETMMQGCPLGEWTGNWIVNGNPILLEDNDKRPFLSFDKFNHPTYYKAEIVDTSLTTEKYNTIWGRYDLLVDGQSVPYPTTRPYSRTIMGINEKGSKLYLMVIDGKRPAYSQGLTLEEAARLLKDLGVYDAMSCDQGGSSCMYSKHIGSIINRPADSDGSERIVYTHFGVRTKGN